MKPLFEFKLDWGKAANRNNNMNDQTQPPPPAQPNQNRESERTKQVTVVGWTAGLTAFFCAGTLINAPIWPVAFGVAALAAMVTVICCFILRRNQP
jgi:hypothetical protein